MSAGVVLVVGGGGYVGSHAVAELLRQGFGVRVYDDFSRGHRDAVPEALIREGALEDRARLRAVFAEAPVAAVMHFAALAYVGEGERDPESYWRNNVAGTLSLLSAMREAGVARLIFSSTCATYGDPVQLPMDETHPQAPVNAYGRTKRACEELIRDFERAYGLRAVIFRYFNAAGADPAGGLGERHDPETHLIPLVFEAVETGRPLQVFGNDYATPDGTCVRDYVHVSDLARAHVRGLERLLAGGAGGAFNLGTGRGHSVREVIRSVERVTGRSVPWVLAPRRAGDPAELVGSARKANEELNWWPAFTELDAIVETAWRFHRARRGG